MLIMNNNIKYVFTLVGIIEYINFYKLVLMLYINIYL